MSLRIKNRHLHLFTVTPSVPTKTRQFMTFYTNTNLFENEALKDTAFRLGTMWTWNTDCLRSYLDYSTLSSPRRSHVIFNTIYGLLP